MKYFLIFPMLMACGPTIIVPDTSDKDVKNDAQADIPPDADTFDSGSDVEVPPESHLYAVTCLTAFSSRNPSQGLRFYTKAIFYQGNLSVEMTPLLKWATTLSRTETIGSTYVEKDVPLSNNSVKLVLGTVQIPKDANGFSDKDLTITSLTFEGDASNRQRFCTTMSGHLTNPYPFDFQPSENTCLFIDSKEGENFPTLTGSDFNCSK